MGDDILNALIDLGEARFAALLYQAGIEAAYIPGESATDAAAPRGGHPPAPLRRRG